MPALAHEFARLIGPFHGSVTPLVTASRSDGSTSGGYGLKNVAETDSLCECRRACALIREARRPSQCDAGVPGYHPGRPESLTVQRLHAPARGGVMGLK